MIPHAAKIRSVTIQFVCDCGSKDGLVKVFPLTVDLDATNDPEVMKKFAATVKCQKCGQVGEWPDWAIVEGLLSEQFYGD